MSEIDPTDHALATIASILEHPGSVREAEKPVVAETPIADEHPIVDEQPIADEDAIVEEHATIDEHPTVEEHTAIDEHPTVDEQPLVPEPADADGYSKFGPGPIEALRFKWAVRRGEDGQYFVHESIGESSTPVVIGPMSSDAAVKLVDERESEAHHRFEALRSEIAGRNSIAELVHKGEA